MPIAIQTPVNSNGEIVLTSGIGDDVIVGSIPEAYCSVNEYGHLLVNTKHIVPVRKKSEVTYSFSPALTLVDGTAYNLINIIKNTTPTSGTLAPFFNVVTNELNCYNEDASVTFKLNVIGSWAGGSTNRSMQVDFLGTVGNRIVQNRNSSVTSDILMFSAPLSIDKNGNIATNGTAVTIQSNGGDFSVTNILLIAEQTVTTDIIL